MSHHRGQHSVTVFQYCVVCNSNKLTPLESLCGYLLLQHDSEVSRMQLVSLLS